MSNNQGGKGDKQRPTDLKKYEDNFEKIFGKKKKQKKNYNNKQMKEYNTK